VLRGDEYMGASLQTMHEQKFDHGVVLSQTPAPGLQVRPHPTMARTTRKLAIECAELLVQGLRDGLHVPPYEDAGWKAKELEGKPLKHAPKITTGDTEVDWVNWTPAEWERHLRLRRAVWTTGLSKGGKRRRLLIHDATQVPEEEVSGKRATMEVMSQGGRDDEVGGFRKLVSVNSKTGDIYILLGKGVWLKVRRATLEGRPEKPAATGVRDFLVDWEESKKPPAKKEGVAEETKTEKQLS
jgi:methionyl-tRNA formyltransferase